MRISSIVVSLLLVLYAVDSVTPKMDPAKVVYAVNCGGKSFKDEDGVSYSKDQFYSPDKSEKSDVGSQYSDWPQFQDAKVYHTERYSVGENLVYKLPVRADYEGKYVLVLKFSEVYFESAGQKEFNIMLGNGYIKQNVDIFKEVGKFMPLDLFFEFTIKGSQVLYQGKQLSNAFVNNQLVLTFEVGRHDNPKINGIVLVKGTLQDTNYEKYNTFRKQIEKKKEDLLKEEKRKKLTMSEDSDEFDYSKIGLKYDKFSTVKDTTNEDFPYSVIKFFLDTNYVVESVCFILVVFFFIFVTFIWKKKKED